MFSFGISFGDLAFDCFLATSLAVGFIIFLGVNFLIFRSSFFLSFSVFLLWSSSILSFSGVSVKIRVLPALLFFRGRTQTGMFWQTCVSGRICAIPTYGFVAKTIDDGGAQATGANDR